MKTILAYIKEINKVSFLNNAFFYEKLIILIFMKNRIEMKLKLIRLYLKIFVKYLFN